MPQDNALTPRSFGGPSNDIEPVNSRKFSGEHRAKIGKALRQRWANMTPEERQAETHKKHATERARIQRLGKPKLRASFVPVWVDDDFDEMGF